MITRYPTTNIALIHLDGGMAISKKKTMMRYLYKNYPVSSVRLETAGTIDLDVELKFSIKGEEFSIDVDKKQIDEVRAIYKALFSVSEGCHQIHDQMEILEHTHDAIYKMFNLRQLPDDVVPNLPDMISQTANQVELHYGHRRNEIRHYDFGSIFERYLK
ncbi:MAG: PH domain-containing protein, partial [Methylococcales bacterium]|nr:PH domain-containing protein [Methylococcales bacterium]MCK5926289.1 PH domain-containing protein [Methylococcales bacterium]